MPPWVHVVGRVGWDVPYLVTKNSAVKLFFVFKKSGWGWG